MRAKGLDADVRLLHQEVVAAPKSISAALRTRERNLLLIERLAFLDREPVAILGAYLSPRTFPGLVSAPLEGRSLYGFLSTGTG